jgi:hypothetical protein
VRINTARPPVLVSPRTRKPVYGLILKTAKNNQVDIPILFVDNTKTCAQLIAQSTTMNKIACQSAADSCQYFGTGCKIPTYVASCALANNNNYNEFACAGFTYEGCKYDQQTQSCTALTDSDYSSYSTCSQATAIQICNRITTKGLLCTWNTPQSKCENFD